MIERNGAIVTIGLNQSCYRYNIMISLYSDALSYIGNVIIESNKLKSFQNYFLVLVKIIMEYV